MKIGVSSLGRAQSLQDGFLPFSGGTPRGSEASAWALLRTLACCRSSSSLLRIQYPAVSPPIATCEER
jgi:hypothetical protein